MTSLRGNHEDLDWPRDGTRKDVVHKTAAAKLSIAGFPNGKPWSQLSPEDQDERKKASDALAYTRNQKRSRGSRNRRQDFYVCIKEIRSSAKSDHRRGGGERGRD